MKKLTLATWSCVFVMFAIMTQPVTAQSVEMLLENVRASTAEERTKLIEYRANLVTDTSEMEKLLNDSKRELDQEEERSQRLRDEFENNLKKLAELEETLHQSQGEIGELFGVFRQTAGEFREHLSMSLTSSEYSGRIEQMTKLSERRELPTISELENLWLMSLQEMIESGRVSRYAAPVVTSSGELIKKDVVRVGQFNAISDGKYLDFVPETGELVFLGRQPKSGFLSEAKTLTGSRVGELVGVYIDPSRGNLLSQLVLAPTLIERIQQGKFVGYVIIFLGFVGFLFFIIRFVSLVAMHRSISRQIDSDEISESNALGRIINIYDRNRSVDAETLEVRLDEAVLKEIPKVEKGLSTIKLLAAVAPLLGLLGTVVGMIETFQSITLFGTGDPKLMAGGISQALVTTVLGLVVAIPLLLSFNVASGKAKRIVGILEEQGAGILATHMEKVKANEHATRAV